LGFTRTSSSLCGRRNFSILSTPSRYLGDLPVNNRPVLQTHDHNRSETLRWSFGVGIIRKKVQVAEIASCEPIRIRWWYGWGIHLTPYGWLYNVAGWDAVVITLRNGRKFALGTDDPHGLAAAIRAAIS
jgi:hypothetical protein